MSDIRLIGLDLDGTVFNDQKRVSPRTLAAIRAALDKGVIVLPATGRTVSGAPREFLSMPGVRYALASNGAVVQDLQTGEKLVELVFEDEVALAVYENVKKYHCMVSIFINGEAYTQRDNAAECNDMLPENLREYFATTRILVDSLYDVMRENAGHIEKFSIMYGDMQTLETAWEDATSHFEVEASNSLGTNMELNPVGVNKGRGLMELAKVLGLKPEQVMACGDGGNDVAMVQMAGIGVAMGNAMQIVKDVADYVTADNNNDGVALAIERFVL